MPLTSHPICRLSGTNCSVDGAAASLVKTMLIVHLLSYPKLARGLLAQEAGRIKRRLEQGNIGLNGLRKLVGGAADRVDAEISQGLHHRGIAADLGQRLGQVLDDRARRSRRHER